MKGYLALIVHILSTFSEIIHEFSLQFAMVPNFDPFRNAWLLVDIFSVNEHMGMLILACIMGIDSSKEQ